MSNKNKEMENMKYTKKPVVIEAIQLLNTPQSILEVNRFIEGKLDIGHNSNPMAQDKWTDYTNSCSNQGGIFLKTLESDGETQKANFGDYIIKGIKGEFYPCKPGIFEKTYIPTPLNEGSESVEELAEKEYPVHMVLKYGGGTEDYNLAHRKSWIKGYTASQQATMDKAIEAIKSHKIPKWASSQTVEGYEYAKKEFTDLLTKLKTINI
jgi:hypothetical protein